MALLSPLVPVPAETTRSWSNTVELTNLAQMPSKLGGDKVPVRLLDQKHPNFISKIECWLDLALLNEGGVALKKRCDRILKKRPREDADVFMARMERFTYQNILGTALGWYGAAMFGKEPEFFFNGKKTDTSAKIPAEKQTYYDKFLSDCDGNGKTFVDFFKRAFQTILVYGEAWILTDLDVIPDGETQAQTLQEQDERGLRDPHLMMYTPINIINYREDARGVLEWVIVKVTTEEQEFLRPPQIVDTWYYFDRQSFRVYEDRRSVADIIAQSESIGRTANLLREGRHAMANANKVPLRKMTLDDGLWLANRVYLLLLDHVNQDNSLAWALFMSNLAVPIIIGDVDTSNMTTSETGFYQFPAGTQYMWSEPDGKSFQQSGVRLESLREEAFRGMHLQAQGRSMHATPAMQSGRSKIIEMVPAHEVLSAMGGSVRSQMQAQLDDIVKSRNDSGVVSDVRGFNFDDDMTTEEIFAVASLLNLKIPSGKFEKYIYKKVARSWMRNANHDQITEVYNEIDSGPTADERAQKDLEQRIKLIQSGMAKALQQVNSPGLIKTLGGASVPTGGTPGKGGTSNAVPPPPAVDISASYSGE